MTTTSMARGEEAAIDTLTAAVNAVLGAARCEGRTVLLEHEAYALIAAAGIVAPAHVFVPAGAALPDGALAGMHSAEVVLKIVSPDILHKTEVGGIAFVPREPAAVAAGIEELLAAVRRRALTADLRGVLVAERIAFAAHVPGTEYLVSLRRDRAFGPVVFFGLGGLLAEWYGRVSPVRTRVLLPASHFDRAAALAAIQALPVGELALAPGRVHREAPVAAAALLDVLAGLARLARVSSPGGDGAAVPVIEEIELNPIAAAGGRLYALDALARIAGGAAAQAQRPPRPVAVIRHLLHPRSAAVYGASGKAMNAGRIILRNLKTANGLTYGKLYAVHPKETVIDGVSCYPDTANLPDVVDLAVVSIPATGARDAIADIVRHQKARSIILIPGGFAETGETGLAAEIQDTLESAPARATAGPVMVGGNCLGIVSKGEYNTFFLPTYKLPFHDAPGDALVAVSQSGAYLVTFTSNLDGIIFPRASVSYGNEMDLTAGDFLEYYIDHEPEARVFAFYIEGFQAGEGERFVGLVRRATADGRVVVIYKAGKTAFGARAAASHTASMAGDYEVARSLLIGAGALVTETLNQFEDFTKILTMLDARHIAGRRVGVVSNAGFECGAVSDHLYTLKLAELAPRTRAALKACLPEIAHSGNPVDATPMADTASFIAAVEAVAADPGVDALIVSAVPAAPMLEVLAPDLSGRHQENIFAMGSLPAEIIRLAGTMTKPLVVAIDSGRLYDPTVTLLQRAGIPVYRKIDRASRALSAFATVRLDLTGRRPH
jgi:acyl-CoA synthetase (NDP forming)